jgi:AmpD protein
MECNVVEIDLTTGLLTDTKYLPSPHCNERPRGIAIDMIVIHCIALPPTQFGNGCIEAFFAGELDFSADPYFETIQDLRVSAHLLISRQGVITQFVPFNLRAWHAGLSVFQGRDGCNDFSVGIELEGSDDLPYEKIQYKKLTVVTQALLKTYPAITHERIVGHSDIAPGRKTDPGKCFDWRYFTGLLAACSA